MAWPKAFSKGKAEFQLSGCHVSKDLKYINFYLDKLNNINKEN